MRFFISGILILCCLQAAGQGLVAGEWKSYLSHREGVGTVTRAGIIYTITKGGMYSYDPEFEEVQEYSTVNGLSGINPTAIHHAEAAGLIFIGYANGMIDYFADPGRFQYLTDINRNTFITQKGIKGFASDQDRLYIAMESGLAIYDLSKGLPDTDVTQFADNPSRISVESVTLFGGRVWVLLDNAGFYSAPIDFPNLKDPSIWRDERGLNALPSSVSLLQIAARSSDLFARADTSVWRFDGTQWAPFPDWSRRWGKIYVTEEAFGASLINEVRVKHNDGPTYNFFVTGGTTDLCVVGPNTFGLSTLFEGGIYFNAFDIKNTTPAGPASNDCVRIAAANGELYIAPQGYDQATAPIFSGLGVYYNSRETGWKILNKTTGTLPEELSTGFARAFYDTESGRAYLGSWGAGLVELEKGEVVNAQTCDDGLSVILPPCDLSNLGNTRVSGMQTDPGGYLWVTLDFAQEPLMLRTPEGNWIGANRSRLPAEDHFLDLLIDDFGNKWILNSEAGLVVYNDRETPENTADDFTISLRSGVNNGNLPTNDVYSFAKDLDGFVWVGTAQGVTVFYDTYSLTQGRIVDASTPVFQRFPLLKDAIIRSIAVDGGNRKWLGTDDGVYLVSPDGDEIIYQFNDSNSPLLSNTVNDIEVDPVTGQVFFATSLGLISFQGDATAPADNCDGLLVFPNPVAPDYSGPITVRGSGAESTVKITTISGLLVKEIQAEGGTAIWDGTDVYGTRVRSGVYLAMSADRNGESGCIGKFVVLGGAR
ncbi:MAG: hypothetical protein NWR72_04690 [Bacteroidia bacterium]|nr:hypothetical protein [Bacteroidia bacterium]